MKIFDYIFVFKELRCSVKQCWSRVMHKKFSKSYLL